MKKVIVAVFLGCGVCVGFCKALSITDLSETISSNGDWEVWSEIDGGEWDKKKSECVDLQFAFVQQDSKIPREKAERQGAKCRLKYAKKLQKLCKKNGHKYCVLEVMLFGGASGEEETIKSLEKSCDGRYGVACVYLGLAYEKRDSQKELEYYEKGCDFGSATACFGAGAKYFKDFFNVQKSREYLNKALAYAENGCKSGYEVACKWQENIAEFMQKNGLE